MIVLFRGSIPKDSKYESENEDAYSYSSSRGIAVVSDGASESFDARTWARLLVKRYIRNQRIDPNWINSACSFYSKGGKYDELSWSKKAAYLRGSFATLLCALESPDKTNVSILAIGDSLAVLIEDEKFIDSFPLKRSMDFSQRPTLISTIESHNSYLTNGESLEQYRVEWQVNSTTRILLMTDAIGAWCLRKEEEGEPQWDMLSRIRHLSELRSIVTRECNSKTMRIDDTTLMVLAF